MTNRPLLSFAFIIAIAGVGSACSSAPAPEAKAAEKPHTTEAESASDEALEPASSEVSAAEAAGCVGEGGELLPCSFNAECCPGYSCGFDPSLSRVQRYCIGG